MRYDWLMPVPARTDAEFEQRFWEKVKKSRGCWLWTGASNRLGYGFVRRRPKLYSSHRLSYELAHGPIEDGMWVLHRCDQPACVRPDHLFLGTQRDNNNDRTAKGRGRRVGTSGAKLTEDQVRQARLLYAGGLTQREIATRFGVTQTAISNLICGRSYSYVKD